MFFDDLCGVNRGIYISLSHRLDINAIVENKLEVTQSELGKAIITFSVLLVIPITFSTPKFSSFHFSLNLSCCFDCLKIIIKTPKYEYSKYH